MRRGSINEQYLKVPHRGMKQPIARGPYYVLSRHEPQTGKTVSRRLTSKKDVEKARTDIAEYHRFVALCREYQELTETLGELEGLLAIEGAEKKRRRLSSSKKPR